MYHDKHLSHTKYLDGLSIYAITLQNFSISQELHTQFITVFKIQKETSTKMYIPFQIGPNQQYGPYAHFGYSTFVSDPQPNNVV